MSIRLNQSLQTSTAPTRKRRDQSRKGRRDKKILNHLRDLREQIDAMTRRVVDGQRLDSLPKMAAELTADAMIFFDELQQINASGYYPPLRAKTTKSPRTPKAA